MSPIKLAHPLKRTEPQFEGYLGKEDSEAGQNASSRMLAYIRSSDSTSPWSQCLFLAAFHASLHPQASRSKYVSLILPAAPP